KRGDYEYIRKKAEDVFYDPKIATKEIVDDVFETVNDRNKLIRTLAIAKAPFGIIWEKTFQRCIHQRVLSGVKTTRLLHPKWPKNFIPSCRTPTCTGLINADMPP